MARQNNRMITFNDAKDMISQEGYIIKSTIPTSNEAMTKQDILNHLHAKDVQFSSYSSTQLVPYNKISPKDTDWRGSSPYCVQAEPWKMFAAVLSTDKEWCFDRFRLYTPNSSTEVAIWPSDPGFVEASNGQMIYDGPAWDSRKFSSTNGFEHDFKFDLSFNADGENFIILAIRGIPSGAKFQQIYLVPTGYSATYGKQAKIFNWDFSVVDVSWSVGGSHGSIINKKVGDIATGDLCSYPWISWSDTTRPPVTNCKVSDFNGSELRDTSLSLWLTMLDNSGNTGGQFNYSNTHHYDSSVPDDRKVTVPKDDCITSYWSLKDKGWDLIGPRAPSPTVRISNNVEVLRREMDASYYDSYRGEGNGWMDVRSDGYDIGWYMTTTGVTWNSGGWFDINNGGFMWNQDYAITPSTNATISVWISTTDNQALFFNNTPTGTGSYIGAYTSSNKGYHTQSGIVTYIDKVNVNNNIHDNLPNGQWHMVEFKKVNISSWLNMGFGTYNATNWGFSAGTKIGKISIYSVELTAAESAINFEADRHIYGI